MRNTIGYVREATNEDTGDNMPFEIAADDEIFANNYTKP